MNPNSDSISVSILMLSYNQEQYIAQAIRSVMRQKTNFKFELVIGDDCSTDSTRAICKSFQRNYPAQIKILANTKNLGLQQNFIRTYHACRGKYIAICEGDDFWISKHKLQRQVDILETHSEFAMCFHRVLNYFEKDGSKSFSNGRQKQLTSILDLASSNYITNVSILFRRGLFGELPLWFSEVSTYDYALHLMNAQFGGIYYSSKVMAAYRIHQKGIWSDSGLEKRLLIALKIRELLINYFSTNTAVCERLRIAWLNNGRNLFTIYNQKSDKEGIRHLSGKAAQMFPENSNVLLELQQTTTLSAKQKIQNRIFSILKFIRKEVSKIIPLPKI